jgi:hypothetical protein
VDGENTVDAKECLRRCRMTSECSWFTFHPDNHFCEMFADCRMLDALSCPGEAA